VLTGVRYVYNIKGNKNIERKKKKKVIKKILTCGTTFPKSGKFNIPGGNNSPVTLMENSPHRHHNYNSSYCLAEKIF
jgi:hypothetical protein